MSTQSQTDQTESLFFMEGAHPNSLFKDCQIFSDRTSEFVLQDNDEKLLLPEQGNTNVLVGHSVSLFSDDNINSLPEEPSLFDSEMVTSSKLHTQVEEMSITPNSLRCGEGKIHPEPGLKSILPATIGLKSSVCFATEKSDQN